MTVSNEASFSGPYYGDGVATVFAYNFKIVDKHDLVALKTRPDGSTVELSLDAGDYTISGVGADEGQVALSVPLAVGETLVLVREVAVTQLTELSNAGAYNPEVVEKRFDLTVMQIQSLLRDTRRAVKSDYGGPALTIDADIADGSMLVLDGGRLVQGPSAADQQATLDAANAASQAAENASQSAYSATASATEAQMYAGLVGAAVYDFNQDSNPDNPRLRLERVMAKIPRQYAGIGAADMADAAAFDAYVGPERELTIDHVRGIVAMHDGQTPGGKRFSLADAVTLGELPERVTDAENNISALESDLISKADVSDLSDLAAVVEQKATPEFVAAAIAGKAEAADLEDLQDVVNGKAPLISPALTGTPTVPTASPGTNTAQAASTAFVAAGLAGKANSVHSHAVADVANLQITLDAKAPLASPALTGTPTAPTAAAETNSLQIATTEFVRRAITNLIASSPAALDTLVELAAALGNDPNFATTTAESLGNRLRVDTAAQGLNGTQQANGRANLALGTAATAKVGTSGASVPLLNNGNAWSGINYFDGVFAARGGTYTGISFYRANSSSKGALYIDDDQRMYFRTRNTAGQDTGSMYLAPDSVLYVSGVALKSPNGSITKTLTIDNSGNLLLDGVAVASGSESVDWNL